jgi:hypothetical protein
MPKSIDIEQVEIKNKEPAKRTRKMTPEALEKLRFARDSEKAIEARRKVKGVNEELVQIRSARLRRINWETV